MRSRFLFTRRRSVQSIDPTLIITEAQNTVAEDTNNSTMTNSVLTIRYQFGAFGNDIFIEIITQRGI